MTSTLLLQPPEREARRADRMAAHIAHSGLAMFRMDKMSRTQPVNALVAHALTRCAELEVLTEILLMGVLVVASGDMPEKH